MMRQRTSIALLAFSAACTSTGTPERPAPVACAPDIAATAEPLTAANLSTLQGQFALVRVATANTVHGKVDFVVRSRLTLTPAGASEREQAHRPRPLGTRRIDLRFLGNDSIGPVARPEPAEVDAGVLWVGCRDCTDTFAEELRILGVTSNGFVGTWVDRDAGLAVIVDRATGRTTPIGDTRGHFCATRLP